MASNVDFIHSYSQVIESTQKIGEASQNVEVIKLIGELSSVYEDMNQTFKYTKTTSDYLIDMNALAAANVVAKNLVRNVNSRMTSFDSMHFAHKLVEKYRNDRGALDLSRLHKYSDKCIKRTTFNPIVLNSFEPSIGEIEIKEKKVVTRRVADKVAEKKTSEKVEAIEKTDLSIDEKVNQIYKTLDRFYKKNNESPICFFQFCLDPNYSKAIENIFHVSFLIRDNRAKLSTFENGLPCIEPVKGKNTGKENGKHANTEDGKTSKALGISIVSIDDREHRNLRKYLKIGSCLISSRSGGPLNTVRRPAEVIGSPSSNIALKKRKLN